MFSLMFFWLVVGDVGCSRPIRVLHRWVDTMQDRHSNLDGVVVVVDVANHAILDVDSILLLDDVLANFHLVDVVVVVVVVAHLLDAGLLLFSANMMFFWVLSTSTGVLVDVLSNVHGDADVPFSLLDADADVLVEHFAVSSVVADVLGLLDVQFPSSFG